MGIPEEMVTGAVWRNLHNCLKNCEATYMVLFQLASTGSQDRGPSLLFAILCVSWQQNEKRGEILCLHLCLCSCAWVRCQADLFMKLWNFEPLLIEYDLQLCVSEELWLCWNTSKEWFGLSLPSVFIYNSPDCVGSTGWLWAENVCGSRWYWKINANLYSKLLCSLQAFFEWNARQHSWEDEASQQKPGHVGSVSG